MIEIHRNTGSIEISPFQEEIALENYFAGANRDNVLFQMKEAMQNGAVLMVLTGEEGSGKTMECHMLKHEASPLCKTVLFPRAVDSFEEVVRFICKELGLGAENVPYGENIDPALEQIIALLLQESSDLLVIFDEAENLFLATLERIRTMRERINEAGVRMHVLFSGRDSFLENCDQLSICDFQRPGEYHFALVPLSQAETANYLRDCAARLNDIDAAKVFSDEIIQNIYELAKGNFRMTNILGEESAGIHNDDTSFMVLLDSVEERAGEKERNSGKQKHPDLLKSLAGYLPWIGGAICCLLLFFFLVGSREDKKNIEKDVDQSGQVETLSEIQTANVIPDTPEKKESTPVKPAGKLPEKNALVKETMETAPVLKNKEQDIAQLTGDVKNIPVETTEPDKKATHKTAPEVAGKLADEAKEPAITAPHKSLTDPAEAVVQKHSVETYKISTNRDSSTKSPNLSSKVRSHTKVHKVIVSNTQYTPAVDKLYNERLLAGRAWESDGKQDMYTVQIMALTSQAAEQNFKKMLAQVNYRQEAGNFYIFKKSSNSGNLFVFYGEYPSIDIARLVTISLPKFLRDHNPYPLSIKGAVAKVNR